MLQRRAQVTLHLKKTKQWRWFHSIPKIPELLDKGFLLLKRTDSGTDEFRKTSRYDSLKSLCVYKNNISSSVGFCFCNFESFVFLWKINKRFKSQTMPNGIELLISDNKTINSSPRNTFFELNFTVTLAFHYCYRIFAFFSRQIRHAFWFYLACPFFISNFSSQVHYFVLVQL